MTERVNSSWITGFKDSNHLSANADLFDRKVGIKCRGSLASNTAVQRVKKGSRHMLLK